jgi:hypothetical protein
MLSEHNRDGFLALYTKQQGPGGAARPLHQQPLTCSNLPTAAATYFPSGLNDAAATGPLKLKWCSNTRLVRAISSARPFSSIDSSS